MFLVRSRHFFTFFFFFLNDPAPPEFYPFPLHAALPIGLWCGSCHDPHAEPEPAVRADFYRARCQKCHQPAACKETAEARREARDDCVACHMPDRKSTRLNSSHLVISYAVFCLKKKKTTE